MTVATELEIEKTDGSRLTVRETQPGIASQLANCLFGSLPTDILIMEMKIQTDCSTLGEK